MLHNATSFVTIRISERDWERLSVCGSVWCFQSTSGGNLIFLKYFEKVANAPGNISSAILLNQILGNQTSVKQCLQTE